MGKTIKLAFAYLKYYKKQTLALFFGVAMSAAFMTGIGSLLYSGRMANLERAREVYGDYHYEMPLEGTGVETADILKSAAGKGYDIERTGVLSVKKVLEEPYHVTIAYGDDTYMEMLGRTLVTGAYPKAKGEIALDAYTIRNLSLSDELGSEVILGGETFYLCGILENQWSGNIGDMKAFVSAEEEGIEEKILYLKFNEEKRVFPQFQAFTEAFHLDMKLADGNNGIAAYVGAYPKESAFQLIKTGLTLSEGKFTYIWAGLNESMNITEKVILLFLGVFGAFVIYSLFQISVVKRTAQYSVMQVLGMEAGKTFWTLFGELGMIFLTGYPVGVFLGTAAAKALYSGAGEIFVNQSIGSVQAGVHVQNTGEVISSITVKPGEFHISWGTAAGSAVFFLVLLMGISWTLVRKMRKFTWREMIYQDTGKRRRSRRIYSKKKENMTGVLTKKFMFERIGTFVGIVMSLSIGGVMFLGTAYVTENTKIHNELTFKADDGLGSDVQIYEDSDVLSDVIPEETIGALETIPGIAKINPVSYILGEIPLTEETFLWPKYFPETAGEEGWEQEAYILEKYNGIITRNDFGYKLKVNVYGYSEDMLKELSAYVLEGSIDLEMLQKENMVILKTLVDGQGNYDGIAVKPGDTITLKVPKDVFVPAKVLGFQETDDWYVEKEFQVAALVSRPLARTDCFIGDNGESQCGIIMSNQQMQENFGMEGYNNISIQLTEKADPEETADMIQRCTAGIRKCLVKDYTASIRQQNLYLKQKMLFFYGIALILFLISLLHIMNSMQYLVVSRKHEFGILRAMGITDAGFCRMLFKEGIRYGIYAGLTMVICYSLVQRVLYYYLVHVYRYLHPVSSISPVWIGGMLGLTIFICVGAVLYSGREVLKDNIVEEIKR